MIRMFLRSLQEVKSIEMHNEELILETDMCIRAVSSQAKVQFN